MAARRPWQAWQSLRDMRQYVFLDECGVTTDLLRRYGRSPSGVRLRDHTPCSHWDTHTVVAALRLDGRGAPAVFNGPIDTRHITAYIALGREGTAGAPPEAAATQRMAARLASADGNDRYGWRKAIVEPVMGWIKAVLGFRRVSLRGEANARGRVEHRVSGAQPEAVPPDQDGLRPPARRPGAHRRGHRPPPPRLGQPPGPAVPSNRRAGQY